MALHPLVERAAHGELPSWAEAGPARREHMDRVAELMRSWGRSLGLADEDQRRWAAAAYLHDALRNADPERLRPAVPPGLSGLPGPLLHGPAAAERLRVGGVRDGALLRAVAYHTLGHPAMGILGHALYAADFLEPGRDILNPWRGELRSRMPGELREVVRRVLEARITYLVGRGSPLRPETVAFWNSLAERV